MTTTDSRDEIDGYTLGAETGLREGLFRAARIRTKRDRRLALALAAVAVPITYYFINAQAWLPAAITALVTTATYSSFVIILPGTDRTIYRALLLRFHHKPTYRSGAFFTPTLNDGTEIPVPPPPELGTPNFYEVPVPGRNTIVAINVDRNARCLVGTIALQGTGAAGAVGWARAALDNEWGAFLDAIGGPGTLIDRITTHSRYAPSDLSAHAEYIEQNDPGARPENLRRSYEELTTAIEATAESAYLTLTVRVPITADVTRQARLRAPKTATVADEFYAIVAAEQVGLVMERADRILGRYVVTGALDERAQWAWAHNTYDPDSPITSRTETPKWTWPSQATPSVHHYRVTGQYDEWLHRTLRVAHWPQGITPISRLDPFYLLQDRAWDRVGPWGIIRTCTVVYNIVPTARAKKQAISDATGDAAKALRDDAQAKIGTDTAQLGQALQRVADLNARHLGLTIAAYIMISGTASEPERFRQTDLSVHDIAQGADLYLVPLERAHDIGLALSIPFATMALR